VIYLNKSIQLIDTQIRFVEKQMQWATTRQQCPLCTTGNTRPKLQWMAKTVDYVEWVYALHSILNTETGKVTLKNLFDTFNEVFGLDVKDFSVYFMSIKNRKKATVLLF
jgi:hypothetical protein